MLDVIGAKILYSPSPGDLHTSMELELEEGLLTRSRIPENLRRVWLHRYVCSDAFGIRPAGIQTIDELASQI